MIMSVLYSRWVGYKVTYHVFSVWGKEGGLTALTVQCYWSLPNSWARILPYGRAMNLYGGSAH